MRITLKGAGLLLAILFVSLAPATRALGEDFGSIIDGGVEMKVRGVVAVHDPDRPQLQIYLLPYEPTHEEIELCQRGRESRISRDPIAPDKWPHWNPRAYYSISWPSWVDGIKVGSHDKAHIFFYAYGIAEANANVNLNYQMEFEEGIEGTLTGKVEPGEKIHFIGKGEDEIMGRTFSWNLDLEATVVGKLPRGE